ncbi:MAG: hypothetical protein UHJ11_05215 [Paludibacteraceae bacterium]|nr:hypothetical protein [Paludibacteraceae bacterium]
MRNTDTRIGGISRSSLGSESVKNNAICMVLNRWKTNRKIEQIAEAKYKKL